MRAFSRYAEVWSVPAARQVLLLGLVLRAPLFGSFVLVTLHVVERLDPRYSAAALVSAAATLAAAVSGPWRGRLLDRHGLRRTVLPSLVVLPACWAIAPWVGYWALLACVVVGGLFIIPTFSVVRQALIAAVSPEQRKAALSLESVLVEVCFMTGPALGVLAATAWGTDWALLVFQQVVVVSGIVLFWVNPPLRSIRPASEPAEREPESGPATRWLSPAVIAVLGVTVATAAALTSTDLGVVAALRTMQQPTAIGWVLAVWGLGSAAGGLAYGMIARPIPAWLVLLGLGTTTALAATATSAPTMAALLLLAGVFCAPSFTAATETLSEVVPERFRGEAFGWFGSVMTAGEAASAPLVGLAIDAAGWPAGFAAGGGFAVLVALLAAAALRRRRRLAA